MSKVTSLTISKQCRLHPFQSKILLLSSSLQMYIRSFVCSENVTTSSSCSPLTAIHVTRISFEFINSIMHLCKIPLRGSTALSVYMYIVTAFGFTAKISTELFRSSVKENVMCVCHKYIYAAAASYTVQNYFEWFQCCLWNQFELHLSDILYRVKCIPLIHNSAHIFDALLCHCSQHALQFNIHDL